jgi:hypothetical protein
LLSGISENKTISDDDLSYITWKAYQEVLDDIYEQHKDVVPKSDPYTGSGFDGTNTEFRTPDKYLADHDGDGQITDSTYSDACDGDISGWWRDEYYEKHDCKVTIRDSVDGNILITQTSGAAIPSTHKGVYITYWTKYRTWKKSLFIEAVEYLAAYKVTRRFTQRDRATLVDIRNNQAIYKADNDMLLKEYEKIRDKIKKPICGGVSY